ncbi:bifunctional sugar phosphate isomerase/epimerase/4-hydroxyphenylpyruvate dioxygenase family protein [Actinoplanes couchii]|uniref:3-dehydroshikimate dehydratase n=1 Tax=Actinoplanes couchii TaxID=403638 RepID=A0ABQ3X8V8_9ACTN|nr:sugar phosphate isomerase/epimerase and 4-hydroxyphenylpyruvate domain-containing protein [Actinoplanes couchii]MDR6325901.1 4-hydroxyphenylpyruvate dioxygenase [Actinoplanes couchii]GID54929.1 4-hydroxyphenylpyruvate dioxygenase [Actinoplanes couchii]
MRRSIATVCVSGTLGDKLSAAAAAGFDGIELFENDLVVSPWSPAEVRSRCADLGLSIDLYQPFRDLDSTDSGHFTKNLERAERKFDLMSALGIDTVLVCSSVAEDAADDNDHIASQLSQLADRAADNGMRIAYEALAWGRHVSTWDRSWEIVRRADHPALGLCLDSFHVLSREVSPDGIAGITPGKIFFLQLADAPHLRMDVLQWSRHHRLFPGQGAFDLPGFVRSVLAAGYAGPLSLEVFNDVFRQADPTRTAIDAMRSLVALEDQLPIAPYAGSSPALRSLPPAPHLAGHAFTEFAVDGRSGPELRTVLRGLGFAHTGQHRTKPVELWEQNSCRVILNSAVTAPGPAAISAFAVTSDDPAMALARAGALLAPAHPNVREPGEAELAAITAPDGTQIFVTDPANPWRADFLPTGTAAGAGEGGAAGGSGTRSDTPGAGLLRVDHLGLAQPFDHFDEAGLFYHSVLGLEHLAAEEYAAPFGLMRSRAVADPARHVRVALTVSLLRRGEWAPAVADPQHIAFTTADIVATAKALALPALPVPANYYDDLAARFALPDALVATLKEHGILYDRDAGGGELLHLYTRVIGGRVFFEIVERRGGYDRFGEPNAPVRMAAQRHQRLSSAPSAEPGPGSTTATASPRR